MWLFVQFVLAAIASMVIAWLIEVVNIPSPWSWGVPAALLTLGICAEAASRVRAIWGRRSGRPEGGTK